MVGVFFFSETIDIPDVEDGSVYVFEDCESATQFIFDKLVVAGFIEKEGADIRVDGESFSTVAEAVEAVQQSFDSSEFFHVYDAFDYRETEQ